MGTAASANDVVGRLIEFARTFIAGRRVIAAGFPAAAATPLVTALRRLGSGRIFVVAPHVGTGALPDPRDAEWVSLRIEAPDLITEIRRTVSALAEPSGELSATLDRFDPAGEALVLTAPFLPLTTVAGRPVTGARRPEWVALEDKTTNDELFDRAGVARPPCEIVAAGDGGGLRAASRRLDPGAGTIWAGDARDGFNGGGLYLRWVTNEAQAVAARRFFEARCGRVRVAPFLDGLPCSIHGLVTDAGVAVFRPVEMVTLRTSDPPGLRYAGAASFYDPLDVDRVAMRGVARRVGELLRGEVGFLGCFGVDGVLTAEGFLPTEVNPRFGAGLATIVRGLPRFPLLPLHWGTVAGEPLPVSPADLEEAVVAAADSHRFGGGWLSVATPWGESREHPVVLAADGYRAARDEDEADGVILTGPGSEGGFIRFSADPERTPAGPSIAPRVVAALAWADDHLGTKIGRLAPAPDLRAAPRHGAPPTSRRAPRPGTARRHLPADDTPRPPERIDAGDGIVLHRARASDAAGVARAVEESLEHLRPWLSWAATPGAADVAAQHERLLAGERAWNDGTDYDYLIRNGDHGPIVGGCSLMRRVGAGAIEIGYWVHPQHLRKGLATAGARALTEAAWRLVDISRVEIHCDEANRASQRVPAKLGYRLDRIEVDAVKAPAEIGRNMVWIKDREIATADR